MKKLLQKIGAFVFSKKGCLVLTVFIAALCIPHIAFATDPAPAAGQDDATLRAISTMVGLGMQFLNSLLWPFLLVMGDLMDVDMITGPGMMERMISISSAIRWLVNMSFVLVLLFVAFYNVIGIGGGEGELAIKTAIPKIILGLILVNFTLPIGRVALDLANVGTNIAFSLPDMLGAGYNFENDKDEFTQNICYPEYDPTLEDDQAAFYQTAVTTTDESSGVETTTTTAPVATQILCADNLDENGNKVASGEEGDGNYDSLNSLLESTYFSSLNKNNLSMIMAANMGKLGSLEILKSGNIPDFKALTVNMIFAIVMYLAFAISYLVMGIVLLSRIFVLWIALALSPLAVLVYVIPQVKEWIGGAGDISQKVIKSLISPIIMGVSMSMGFLLMDAWSSTQGSVSAFGTFTASQPVSASILVSGIDDLPKMILAVASIMVVWTGVFAAADGTYAATVTGSIKSLGNDAVSALGKGAMSINTLAIGTKDGGKIETSPGAAFGLTKEMLQDYNSSGSQAGITDLAKNLGIDIHGVGAATDRTAIDLNNALKDAARSGSMDTASATQMATEILQMLDASDLENKSTLRPQVTTVQNTINNKDATADAKTQAIQKLARIVDENFGSEKMKGDKSALAHIKESAHAIVNKSITVTPSPDQTKAAIKLIVDNNATKLTKAAQDATTAAASSPLKDKVAALVKSSDDANTALAAAAADPEKIDAAKAAVTAAKSNVTTFTRANPTTGALKTAIGQINTGLATMESDLGAIK